MSTCIKCESLNWILYRMSWEIVKLHMSSVTSHTDLFDALRFSRKSRLKILLLDLASYLLISQYNFFDRIFIQRRDLDVSFWWHLHVRHSCKIVLIRCLTYSSVCETIFYSVAILCNSLAMFFFIRIDLYVMRVLVASVN